MSGNNNKLDTSRSAANNNLDDSSNMTETTRAGLLTLQNSFCHHRRHSDPLLPDLLGNLPLHHAFAGFPDVNKIRNLLTEYPDGARFQNQFGRIPLHYAVDRSKVNMDALKLLLDAYPAGANLKATDGATPYDLGMCSYF